MQAHQPADARYAVSARSEVRAGGFSLIELLVVVALIGLVMAIVAPNLGALVPSMRLDGSGKAIQGKLAIVRSEARIQGKRMEVEFDLDKARWRILPPPEERLTSDQIVYRDEDFGDEHKDWFDLEHDVVFAGAGEARKGLFEKGRYRLVFDEYGFTGDQVIALRLVSDPTMVWSLAIQGLTGQITTERSERGEILRPVFVDDGAFL